MTSSANNIIPFESSDDPTIKPDRHKLSSGAAAIRDKFSMDELKKIKDAKRVRYVDAMVLLDQRGNCLTSAPMGQFRVI